MSEPIQVVTYIAPHSGATLNICQPCSVRTPWPKTQQGREYCQVSRGLHAGGCDICGAGKPAEAENEQDSKSPATPPFPASLRDPFDEDDDEGDPTLDSDWCDYCQGRGKVTTADFESYFGANFKPCPKCEGDPCCDEPPTS